MTPAEIITIGSVVAYLVGAVIVCLTLGEKRND